MAKRFIRRCTMAGYHNYSMSNNAVMAYQTGEMPKSKWTKTAIINALIESDAPSDFIKLAKTYSVNALREALLYQSSWHHTSKHYNKTNFYSVEEVYEDNVADFIDKLKKIPLYEGFFIILSFLLTYIVFSKSLSEFNFNVISSPTLYFTLSVLITVP